ncbi:MAG: rod shape-determining protein MreC [Desulfotignum sp.]|nr:rod shape-determining protein MreC [Desulfotignum sp.]
MFSRKMFLVIGVGLFVVINLIVITMTSRQPMLMSGPEKVFITLAAPFQLAVQKTISMTASIWQTYFAAVLAVKENEILKNELSYAQQIKNQNQELVRENARLKKFVNFTTSLPGTYVAARVIARDPSPWFKTIIIDKGEKQGLEKNAPVLVPEGIVGQIIKVSPDFSKVLLITDRNSAVDALVQNTRARGMVKGGDGDFCVFVYALRKEDIHPGETIVSSGLDQVFPKGLEIGRILDVKKEHAQLFQEIIIQTSVDFDKLEEVLVYKK